ncbi:MULTISPECIES: TrkH family potassium uptake protein [unclassified Helicobacter]|uniref:TrkH family potassium uptake protein n=1 Tax=unclassified Helicobacter TaxID=2593540 RepID=UPI000CF07A6B|nr:MULTISPECIES: potassium transporter TrkG [unclassified Helicobacter]
MNLKSIKFLLLSYIGIALIAAAFLSMPFSRVTDLAFIDAFFTATSALACTGLIVKDTALDFTFTGHCILLFLVQLGGFGYMTMLGLIYVALRKRLGSAEKNMLKEALNYSSYDNLMDFIKKILVYVVIIESIGALILSLDFSVRFGIRDGIWYGIFHSITAFNNGGFSIFPDSLMDFRTDILINTVICILVILGGIGYICLAELHYFAKYKVSQQPHTKTFRFSLHFKIVFSATIILILFGAIVILILEWNNPKTFSSFSFFEKIMTALFTSINYRSAGFVTYDISNLNDSTLFFSTILMLIGGSPGGTAAGIKITTLAVLFAFCRSILSNTQPRLFNRTIPQESVQKALMIFLISSLYFLVISLLLAFAQPNLDFFPLIFEVNAAFSNVGISTGNGGILSLSAVFNDAGKILIIIAMILGKIGVLVFTFALFGKSKVSRIQYPTEKVIL